MKLASSEMAQMNYSRFHLSMTINPVSFLLGYLWIYETIIRYGKVILGRVPIVGRILYEYLPVGVIIVFCLASLPFFARQIRWKDVVFTLAALLISLITIIINSPVNAAFEERYFSAFMTHCFPCYFLGLALANKIEDRLLTNLYILSVASIFISTFSIIRNGLGLIAEWSANMYLPYVMLPHALLSLWYVFKKISPWRLIPAVISFLYIVLMGNRGSLICYFVFLSIIILRKYMNTKSRKLIFPTIALISIIVLLLFSNVYNIITDALYRFALQNGFSVRIFLTMKSDSGISLDSGRLAIYKEVLSLISNNLLGYGLASDVYFIGGYSHNIILELLLEFGLFITVMVIGFIIYYIIKSYRNNKHNNDFNVVLWMLFCVSLVKLMVSGTYLTEPYFFLFIGFIVGGTRNTSNNNFANDTFDMHEGRRR